MLQAITKNGQTVDIKNSEIFRNGHSDDVVDQKDIDFLMTEIKNENKRFMLIEVKDGGFNCLEITDPLGINPNLEVVAFTLKGKKVEILESDLLSMKNLIDLIKEEDIMFSFNVDRHETIDENMKTVQNRFPNIIIVEDVE